MAAPLPSLGATFLAGGRQATLVVARAAAPRLLLPLGRPPQQLRGQLMQPPCPELKELLYLVHCRTSVVRRRSPHELATAFPRLTSYPRDDQAFLNARPARLQSNSVGSRRKANRDVDRLSRAAYERLQGPRRLPRVWRGGPSYRALRRPASKGGRVALWALDVR